MEKLNFNVICQSLKNRENITLSFLFPNLWYQVNSFGYYTRAKLPLLATCCSMW